MSGSSVVFQACFDWKAISFWVRFCKAFVVFVLGGFSGLVFISTLGWVFISFVCSGEVVCETLCSFIKIMGTPCALLICYFAFSKK